MLGCALLAIAVAASLLLVDPAAEDAFDRPKRLATVLGTALAAVLLCTTERPFAGRVRGRAPRAIRALAVVAVAGVVASAFASPRAALARDALRGGALVALALPLGASRFLEGGRRIWIVAAFLGGATADAILSLAERALDRPLFALESMGGRASSAALVGNEGQLALVLALALVAAVALAAGVPRLRAWSGTLAAVLAGAMAVNGSVSALVAAVVGTAVVVGAHLGRAALRPLATVAAIALAFVVATPSLRDRAVAIGTHARAGAWDDVLSNRLGPWAAAVEMARARPGLGFGPGTFGAEFVPHRLAAEIRFRRRFVIPVVTSSYSRAHSEPLQAAAEWGLPAAAAAAAAAMLLMAGLVRAAASAGAADTELVLLAGTLAAASVAALTWFPLQQPSTSLWLLLAAGRGWRRLA